MKTVYYAHPLSLYGTNQELRDINTLEALGFKVVSPNTLQHDAGYKREGMDYFIPIIRQCEALAFRAFPDGSIPAGVAQEIRIASNVGIAVFELPSAVMRRELSLLATQVYLAEGGQR